MVHDAPICNAGPRFLEATLCYHMYACIVECIVSQFTNYTFYTFDYRT